MTKLSLPSMRRPKPGLELSFRSSLGFAFVEAHSERANKWLVDRFGKVTKSSKPRLTKDVLNLGFVMVSPDSAAKIEAEAANLGFVIDWNPASQDELDLEEASRSSTRAEADPDGRDWSMLCKTCGAKNPQDSANCYNCGQKIGTSAAPVRPKNVPEPAGNPSLHASLARRYGLSIEQSSYSDLKNRFFLELDQKRNRGVAPDAEEGTLLAQIFACMHLFFFTAVDRNGLTRFFDVMEDDHGFSIAETATTAPRLAPCRETVLMVPASAEFHHVHRIYSSHKKSEMPSAFAAIDQFGKACGLTGIVKIAETLNPQQARPTWSLIFRRFRLFSG